MSFTTNYSEVQAYQGTSLRSLMRNMALDTLAIGKGITDVEKWYSRPRIQFLFFHHIFDDEVKNFDILLQELSKHHTFISHTEAVDRIIKGNIDRPYISWSSDDGFKNNVKAAEVLNRYDAKACFFINPDSIGKKDKQWIGNFCANRFEMPAIEFLNWDEVLQLKQQGHEIGSHTMNHLNISKRSIAEIRDDLTSSKEVIERYCGKINHFAFPYGRYFDFNKAAFDFVFEVGYDSCATGERGCHITDGNSIDKNELYIRRDQIVSAWKLKHMLYFIANNSKKAELSSNYFRSV